MAGIDSAIQADQQPIDVSAVQACRRFIKDVEVVLAAFELTKFCRQFYPLCLSSGKYRR